MILRIAGGKTAQTESKGFVSAYNKGVEARKKSETMDCPYSCGGFSEYSVSYHSKFWNYGWNYQDEQMRANKVTLRQSKRSDDIDWSKVPIQRGRSLYGKAMAQKIAKIRAAV